MTNNDPIHAFFSSKNGVESSTLMQVLYSLIELDNPTSPNIMLHTGVKRSALRYNMKILQAPFPQGLSMVIEHTGRLQGFKITDYGIASEKLLRHACDTFNTKGITTSP
jgi:hypothetical protein